MGLLSVGFLGFTILNSKTLCTLKLYKWECLKGQGGREERVRRKEGKGSRQRGGHPFPFSLALLRAWMIPRSRQLQQLSNSNLAHPPWFTTPHRWHRVRLRPLTNHLYCALFLQILGCATGAGKNIASHASPPPPPPPDDICVQHKEWREFFSPGAALPQTKYSNAYYHCNVPCIQSRCPFFTPDIPANIAIQLLPIHTAFLFEHMPHSSIAVTL